MTDGRPARPYLLQTPCAGMTRIRFEGLRCPALSAPRRSPVGFFCCAAERSPGDRRRADQDADPAGMGALPVDPPAGVAAGEVVVAAPGPRLQPVGDR